MTPREFQKSNLAIELKARKKRPEDALRGLSDEQCERTGATRPGSVVDLLSEIVTKEFSALMEISDRLPSFSIIPWRMQATERRLLLERKSRRK